MDNDKLNSTIFSREIFMINIKEENYQAEKETSPRK